MNMHQQPKPMDEQDYLYLDRHSVDIRYEYINGHVYAMAGGSLAHTRIAFNIERHLDDILEKTPCQAYSKDARTQVLAGNNRKRGSYLYPDVVITCDVADDASTESDIVLSPRVVFEVLSDSTEHRDRGIKAILYRNCPTIEEIVYVHQDQRLVEVVTRDEKEWKTSIFTDDTNDQNVYLESLDLYIPLQTIYRRVKF